MTFALASSYIKAMIIVFSKLAFFCSYWKVLEGLAIYLFHGINFRRFEQLRNDVSGNDDDDDDDLVCN